MDNRAESKATVGLSGIHDGEFRIDSLSIIIHCISIPNTMTPLKPWLRKTVIFLVLFEIFYLGLINLALSLPVTQTLINQIFCYLGKGLELVSFSSACHWCLGQWSK